MTLHEDAPAAPSLRVGDVLEVSVEKGVYRGLGLARHGGQVVFVPRGFPGDRLRVRVESTSRGYVRAAIEAILDAAEARRPSPCPYVPRCGGCAYQELTYGAQVALKGSIVRETLARAGVAWEGEIPVHGSPEEAWRMRCSFHLGVGPAGDLRLGLREEGSHRVVDLGRCLQISGGMNRSMRGLLAGLAERPSLARSIRGVDLAESLDGAAIVACLQSDLSAREAASLGSLAERAPGLTGLGVVVGDEGRKRFLSLRGDPHVESEVAGIRFRAHVRSFFQANRFLVEGLVREVLERTPPGGTVLDLYAGVGLFALPLARGRERVLGVELSGMAVEDAAFSAQRAGLASVRIQQGDVLAALASWRVETRERIVLDPPRTGAGRAVVEAVAARRPESIVYVSCDPATLGRDLKSFVAEGYRIASVVGFDLFPDTFHVEAVAHLVPA